MSLRLVWMVSLSALPSVLAAQEPQAALNPSVVFTAGTSSRGVSPDLAVLTLEFSAEGATPAEAGRRLTLRADSIRRAIQALGIPRDSLISGNPWRGRGRIEKTFATRTITVPNGPPGATWHKQDTVYRANDIIQARVRDLTKLGPLIDTALAYGVFQIPDLSFAATNTSSLRADMLRAATLDARMQAMAMAEASGTRLGRLLSLSTQEDGRGNLMESLITMRADAAANQVVRPQITVTAVVYARWELVSAQ